MPRISLWRWMCHAACTFSRKNATHRWFSGTCWKTRGNTMRRREWSRFRLANPAAWSPSTLETPGPAFPTRRGNMFSNASTARRRVRTCRATGSGSTSPGNLPCCTAATCAWSVRTSPGRSLPAPFEPKNESLPRHPHRRFRDRVRDREWRGFHGPHRRASHLLGIGRSGARSFQRSAGYGILSFQRWCSRASVYQWWRALESAAQLVLWCSVRPRRLLLRASPGRSWLRSARRSDRGAPRWIRTALDAMGRRSLFRADRPFRHGRGKCGGAASFVGESIRQRAIDLWKHDCGQGLRTAILCGGLQWRGAERKL